MSTFPDFILNDDDDGIGSCHFRANGSCVLSWYLDSLLAEILEWPMLICDSKLQEALSLPPPLHPHQHSAAFGPSAGGVRPCQGVKFLSNLKTKSLLNGGGPVLPGVLFLNSIQSFLSPVSRRINQNHSAPRKKLQQRCVLLICLKMLL